MIRALCVARGGADGNLAPVFLGPVIAVFVIVGLVKGVQTFLAMRP